MTLQERITEVLREFEDRNTPWKRDDLSELLAAAAEEHYRGES